LLGFLGASVKNPAFGMNLRLDDDFKDVEKKNLLYVGMNDATPLFKSWKIASYLDRFYSGVTDSSIMTRIKNFIPQGI
jgi:hypothetical protein